MDCIHHLFRPAVSTLIVLVVSATNAQQMKGYGVDALVLFATTDASHPLGKSKTGPIEIGRASPDRTCRVPSEKTT